MRQKVLTGTFVVVICVLFIFCAGCFSTKDGMRVPVTQTSVTTEMHTVVVTAVATPSIRSEVIAVSTLQSRDNVLDRDGTLVRDAAFIMVFNNSAQEIANKTDLVIFEMSQSETLLQVGYSPARLYLAAEDLGFTTEKDYNLMLKTEATTPENEAKRIAYIQFLYPAYTAAYHIADAAEAESFGDYQNALAMAAAAKVDLQAIKENPALPPITRLNRLNIYLTSYIGKMQDKVVQQQNLETNKRPQTPDRFPRLP
jgi:hypothetical protein